MVSTKTNLKIDGKRLLTDFDNLSDIGATIGGGVSRLALSNDDVAARAWFADRIEEANLHFNDDEAGNLGGILPSDNPNAKTLLIGSHLDTVPNGGRYDGAIGVLAGLECLRTIKESDIKLNHHVEVINFTDEEGTWKSLFGSLGLTGQINDDDLNDALQDNGPFRAALFRAGILPSEVQNAKRDPKELLGYLELHIEQSKKLFSAGVDIGLVTRIVGRTTYNLTFFGEAAHAGTTTAEERRDALQGAAAFIILVHNVINQEFEHGVVNCGHIGVKPDTFNVVPAQASLRVECRHQDPQKLRDMESRIIHLAQDCAKDYGLSVGVDRVLHRPPEVMSDNILKQIEQSCRDENVKFMDVVSYAGHDAQIMNSFVPTGMIFIPSVDGISHNPKEFTEWHHVEMGANILLHTILRLTMAD